MTAPPNFPRKRKRSWRRRIGRVLGLLSNVHRVHHIRWSCGYVFRPLPWGWFKDYGWRRVSSREYHDCTWSGVY